MPRVSYYFPKGVGEYHFGVRVALAVLPSPPSASADSPLALRSFPHARSPTNPPLILLLLIRNTQERHPMKPHRLTLTNHLVVGYGLHKKMDMYNPRAATAEELEAFHDEDYVDFLSR